MLFIHNNILGGALLTFHALLKKKETQYHLKIIYLKIIYHFWQRVVRKSAGIHQVIRSGYSCMGGSYGFFYS